MTSITLYGCKNCVILPSLGRLPSLVHLGIYRLKTIEKVDASFLNNNTKNDGSLLTPFPSLESLEFKKMPCWEVWSCSEPRAFPQLKRLTIEDCPKLKGDLPSHLPALEELEIKDCEQLACSLPWAPAIRQMTIIKSKIVVLQELPVSIECLTIEASPMVTESIFEAFINKKPTCLRSLELRDCSCSFGMSFPGGCLPASQKTLYIEDFRKLEFPQQQQQTHELLEWLEIKSSCDSLTSLPLESFPNLKRLSISGCESLVSLSVSESRVFALQNLILLEVRECPNLVSLAREGLAAPNLIRIVVSDCDKLESLPPQLNTLLPNLKSLQIGNCPRIESFPAEGMPPSLTFIEISNCEKLVSGVAWPSMDMLTHARINGPCHGIKSFPKESLLPPSLQSLYLGQFTSLETFDCKQLLHLTSLQRLAIDDCPKLDNMAGERLPASLTELHISACPLLTEQCPSFPTSTALRVEWEVIS